jgi:death-on-curing family protein
MRRITLPVIEHIIFSLAQENFTFNEPIPGFSTRFPNILESCLETPFQTFAGKDLYPGFFDKAGILFYLMIKNHPFKNGNKRIAMSTLLVVLYSNDQWIKVDTQVLYNFAVWVAESPADAKDQMLNYIKKFLKTYAMPLEKD